MENTTVLVARHSRAPSMVLSLLTAISNTFPRSGKEGEDQLAQQICELLQDKTLPILELSLLYCYRFGFSLGAALEYVAFSGSPQEFLANHIQFTVHDGCVSTVNASLKSTASDNDETVSTVDPDSLADAGSNHSESNSDVDSVTRWHALGARLAATICDDEPEVGVPAATGWRDVGSRLAAAFSDSDSEAEAASPSPSDIFLVSGQQAQVSLAQHLSSMLRDRTVPVSELRVRYLYKFGFSIDAALEFAAFDGSLSDFLETQSSFAVQGALVSHCSVRKRHGARQKHSVDPAAWCKVGSRLASAFQEDSEDAYNTDDISTVDTDHGYEADEDAEIDSESEGTSDSCTKADAEISVSGWNNVQSRVASAFRQCNENISDDGAVTLGCCNVNGRLAAALKHLSDDEDAVNTQEKAPAVAWCEVSTRFVNAFKECSDESDEFTVPAQTDSAASWGDVNARIAAALRECSSDEGEAYTSQDANATVDVPAWNNVGNRMAAAFQQCSDVED